MASKSRKRSQAAKRGWATRRAKALQRSQAAKRGWATRRAKGRKEPKRAVKQVAEREWELTTHVPRTLSKRTGQEKRPPTHLKFRIHVPETWSAEQVQSAILAGDVRVRIVGVDWQRGDREWQSGTDVSGYRQFLGHHKAKLSAVARYEDDFEIDDWPSFVDSDDSDYFA